MPKDLTPSFSNVTRGGLATEFQERLLELLLDLEGSFRGTQEALLSRDLQEIEQFTREQVELQRALSIILNQADSEKNLTVMADPDALWSTHKRVLELTRVNCVLLRRSQQSLRVLSCWRDGTSSPYSAVARMPRIVPSTLEGVSEEA